MIEDFGEPDDFYSCTQVPFIEFYISIVDSVSLYLNYYTIISETHLHVDWNKYFSIKASRRVCPLNPHPPTYITIVFTGTLIF